MFRSLRNSLAKEFLNIDIDHLKVGKYLIPNSIIPEIYAWCKEAGIEKTIKVEIDYSKHNILRIKNEKLPDLVFSAFFLEDDLFDFQEYLKRNIWKLIWKDFKLKYFFIFKEHHTIFIHKQSVNSIEDSVKEHLDKTSQFLDPADWYYGKISSVYSDSRGREHGLFMVTFLNDESHNFYLLTTPKD